MSWKSIAGNQTISRANLQNAIDTGVFIQKNGVPATETNRQITKANAQDYVYTWDLYPPFKNKSSNELPVKSNLAVQSNQVYAVGGQILIGNTNRNWICYLFYAGGDNWGSVASSTDNRCILAGKRYDSGSGGGSAYVSSDFGETFTRLDSIITTNDACMGAAMNSYGDYMIITKQVGSFGSSRAFIYWSQDSGLTWATGFHDATDYAFNGAAMSGVGVYATVLGSDNTSYYVWTSSTYGSTWTKTFLCNGIKILQGGCVGMSKSGQYQLLTPPRASAPDVGYFYVSNNYGTSWTTVNLTPIPLPQNDTFYGCSVSAGGDYMTVAAYSTALASYRTYISNDFGVSWTSVSGSDIAQAVDSSGQFQYQNYRASIDYGNTWTANVIGAYAISVNSTTYTTPYMYGVLNGVDYPVVSTDQGVTFSSLTGIGVGNYNDIACSGGSNNGKYVVIVSALTSGYSYLYQSSDYGATFTTLTYYSGTNEFKRVCISDDGLHILAALYDSSTQRSQLLYSYGGSGFSAVTISGLTYVNGEIKGLCIAKNGANSGGFTVYRQSNNTSYIYITTTHTSGAFNNWTYTGYSNSGLQYNEISCSGFGKYMTIVSRDNSDNSGRIYSSANYGVTFTQVLYSGSPDGRYSGLYCDNSGLNGVAIAGGIDYQNLRSKFWVTKDYWANYETYTLPYTGPVAGDLLAGINISTDATYWTLVVNNYAHTFTNSTGVNTWTQNNLASTLNFKRLSK
jgi:hypothetical protein